MTHYVNPKDDFMSFNSCITFNCDNDVIESIYLRIKSTLYPDKEPSKLQERKLKFHVKTLLANLYSIYCKSKDKFMAISMSPNNYRTSRYNPRILSHLSINRVLRWFEGKGLVDIFTGFKDGKVLKRTRVRPSDELSDIFDVLKSDDVTTSRKLRETIILKDSDKRGVDYRDNRFTNKARKNLEIINQTISRVTLNCDIDDSVDFNSNNLHRVFNNKSFKQGGRFYGGWWQSLKSSQRRHITIDGEGTVELDFRSMHIDMLYAKEGLPLPKGDAYIYEGLESHRSKIKEIMNAMINAKDNRMDIKGIPEGYTLRGLKMMISANHKDLNKYFNTGYGTTLQYLDSQIAEGVMLNLNKQGIACLPVHDSFIVQAKHKELLRTEMIQQFANVVGRPPEGVDEK